DQADSAEKLCSDHRVLGDHDVADHPRSHGGGDHVGSHFGDERTARPHHRRNSGRPARPRQPDGAHRRTARARIRRSSARQPAPAGEGGMSPADVTRALEHGATDAAPHAMQPMAQEHIEASAPGGVLASPTSILLGSLAFGIVFLLAWQFVPPALGVPSYIIPTVTDLAHELGRMVERENLFGHVLSTVTIATLGFIIGSLLGAAMGYVLGMS